MRGEAAQPLNIVEMPASQIEPIANSMARAFAGEAMMRYVIGNSHDADDRLARLFVSGLHYAMSVGVVYVPDGMPAGAAMCWPLPAREPANDIAAMLEPPEAALGAESAARFNEVVERAESLMQQAVPPPVWYLPALGVDPAFQGRGIGTALMRNLMTRSEIDDIPASWATWSESNVRFYQGLGAEIVGEGELPGPNLHYWIFRWVPGK